MTRRIEFTVADEIGEKYDEARGHEPLASWIKRALESALDGRKSADSQGLPAPSRTPAEGVDRATAFRNAAKAGKR